MAVEKIVRVDHLSSASVSDFVTVARRFCDVVDGIDTISEAAFLQQTSQLVPMAYALAESLEWPWHYEGEDDDDDSGTFERALPEPPLERHIELSRHLQRFDLPRMPELPFGGHIEWWSHLREVLGQKLSWHRLFRFVFDPTDPKDGEVIHADLADCIADIYIELKIGLLYFERDAIEDKAQAVWHWKFGSESTWGQHSAEIMLPIHHLLHTHYDEDEDRFDL